MTENAISPKRSENFPDWYQEVIKASELAENSPERGCMVIKLWGYGIWEKMQGHLDKDIKATGHENAYCQLLIPLSFLEKEAAHVEGFAKECAVVTHHRLVAKDGKLYPAGELDEALVIRPTSETIIGDAFSKWVKSYRDLPLLINQWANVMRWEMRTRLFLRTTEFLWQEGHTVHENEKEAIDETLKMLEVYRSFIENVVAMPVIPGTKPAYDRFPGAVETYSIEAMMQDGKALQAGTSHYLGQNFSKACDIKFLNRQGALEYGYNTSLGVSTRIIGGMIMTHADDDGLRVPPRIAPKQVVIIPVIPKDNLRDQVMTFIEKLATDIRKLCFDNAQISVHVDGRDIRGGEKAWGWVKKGAPIRLEVGPREIAENSVMLYRRDSTPKDKQKVSVTELLVKLPEVVAEIQANYLRQAKKLMNDRISTEPKNFWELKEFFTSQDEASATPGFVKAKWSGAPETEELLGSIKASIRCVPLDQSGSAGKCIFSGREAKQEVIIAKAY